MKAIALNTKTAAPKPAVMKIVRYNLSVDVVPVDFFADPDGPWEFDELVEAAGFEPDRPGICVGALTEAFRGHREGSAVVTEMGRDRQFVAIAEYMTPSVAPSSVLPVSASEQRNVVAPSARRGQSAA